MPNVTASGFCWGLAKKLASPGESASQMPPFARKIAYYFARKITNFARKFEWNVARKISCHGWAAAVFDRPVSWPVGQLLTRQARREAATSRERAIRPIRHALPARPAVLALIAAAIAVGCRSPSQSPRPAATATRRSSEDAPARGGAAIASMRTEPRSFNRLAARDSSTDLVATLTQAKLVRINKLTQEVEPWLAERWTADPDGRRYTLALRSGVVFSDGHPFTAEDVVFTFQAVYDATTQSPLADALKVGGRPIAVSATDPHTVVLTFPSAFAPGLRLLNNLPILPKHKLDSALRQGTLASAWGLSTPPADVVGLGPFVLAEYVPGQHLVFDRNPKYWRVDAHGTALPYLDRLTIEIIPDQSAQLLRLQAGQIDITTSEVPPEAYAATKRAAQEGTLKLYDLGVALVADSLWFNLKPGAFAGDPRAAWLQRDEFRRAISMAVDRQRFADTVFFGAGEVVDGPETRSNKHWYYPETPSDAPPRTTSTKGPGSEGPEGPPRVPYDPDGARKLLASIGLVERHGILEDANHRPVRFTLITQVGRPRLERGAAVVRDELKKIGVVMEIAALDGNAVVERFVSAKYDAVYFSPQPTDTDPGTNPDFWLSSGTAHLWNMAQAKPATDWERQIDELMAKQVASPDEGERRRIFADVLRVFHEHQPVLYFAAPKVFVAVSARTVVTPALDVWPALWSPDSIAVH
jgi:peptide/nickel transport system substrate-binding protein